MQPHTGAILTFLYKGMKYGFPGNNQIAEIRMTSPRSKYYDVYIESRYSNVLQISVGKFWTCKPRVYIEHDRYVRIEHNGLDDRLVNTSEYYFGTDRITDLKVYNSDGSLRHTEYGTTSITEGTQTRLVFDSKDARGNSVTKEYAIDKWPTG